VVFDHFNAFKKPLAKQLYNLSLHKIRQEEGACLVRPDNSSKSFLTEKTVNVGG
jgi:hypothetical protein